MSTTTPDEPQDGLSQDGAPQDGPSQEGPSEDSTSRADTTTEDAAATDDDQTAVLPVVGDVPAVDDAAAEETGELPDVRTDSTAVLPSVARDTAALPSVARDRTAQPSVARDTTEIPAGAGVPLEKRPQATGPATSRPTPAVGLAHEAPVEQPQREIRRRLRVSTVVWGLMLVAAGVWILAWASGARIDAELTLIVLLAAGGAALLVGSIVSGARHSRS